MQKLEIGGRGYQIVQQDTSITFTPLFDRAAKVTNITISNPDGDDTWTIVNAGREIGRALILATGSQQPYGNIQNSNGGGNGTEIIPQNVMTIMRDQGGIDMSIPVRNGMTLSIQSLGGAKADLIIEFEEVDVGDLNPSMPNHDQGNTFIIPVFGQVTSSVDPVGNIPIDTFTAPPWVPNLMSGVEMPPGFSATLHAIFLEGMGINTYDSSSDTQSATVSLNVTRNGQQMFTRDAKGIPLVGAASATGSGNTAVGQTAPVAPPVQASGRVRPMLLDPPLTYNQGDLVQFALAIAGDATGGADYSQAVVVAVARITRP